MVAYQCIWYLTESYSMIKYLLLLKKSYESIDWPIKNKIHEILVTINTIIVRTFKRCTNSLKILYGKSEAVSRMTGNATTNRKKSEAVSRMTGNATTNRKKNKTILTVMEAGGLAL